MSWDEILGDDEALDLANDQASATEFDDDMNPVVDVNLDFEADTFPTAEVDAGEGDAADEETDFWDSLADAALETLDEAGTEASPPADGGEAGGEAGGDGGGSGGGGSGGGGGGSAGSGGGSGEQTAEPTDTELDDAEREAALAEQEAVSYFAPGTEPVSDVVKRLTGQDKPPTSPARQYPLGNPVLGVLLRSPKSPQTVAAKAIAAGKKAIAVGKRAKGGRGNKAIAAGQRAIKAGESLARKQPLKPLKPLGKKLPIKAPVRKAVTVKAPLGRTFNRPIGTSVSGAATLKSPLEGVSDDAWTKFVRVMVTADKSNVSASNCLGMFEMTPRRMADLGLVDNLSRKKSPKSGRTVWVCEFVKPLTADKFLRDAQVQYKVFSASMADYAKRLRGDEIPMPRGMSMSSALAILHRGGPPALSSWTSGGPRFPETARAAERAGGIF